MELLELMFFNELIVVVSETALLFTVYGLVSRKCHSVGRRNYLVAVIVGLQGAIAGKVRIVELILQFTYPVDCVSCYDYMLGV